MTVRALRRLVERPAVATLASAAIITAYCLVRYRDCLFVFFFLDDFWVLRDAARIPAQSVWDVAQIFHLSHNGFLLYRPLTTVGYFYLLRNLFAYDASAYHMVQLLAHAVNALLVFGITRRLADSRLAACAAAIMYAAAPGHGAAMYWMSAFCMTGNALVVFLLLWCWLRLESGSRLVCCTILQAIALLAGEHAAVGPVLLALVALFSPRREPWGRVALHLTPPFLLAGAYLSLKLWYLTIVRPMALGTAYALSFDGWGWLERLGRYSVACFNALTLMSPGVTILTVLGISVIALAVLSSWQSLRGVRRWDCAALGSTLFIVGLLPVLPLRGHYYDYFIGIAAMGAALAAVGVCQLVSRHWRWLAVGLATGIVLLDVITHERATRSNALVVYVRSAATLGARWLMSVQLAAAQGDHVREVLVPRVPATVSLFEKLETHRLFQTKPTRITLYDRGRHPPVPGRGQVVVRGLVRRFGPGQRLPGWDPRWDWLRRVAGTG